MSDGSEDGIVDVYGGDDIISPARMVDRMAASMYSEDEVQRIIRDVALAAYRSGKYRGEFNGSKVDALGQQIIERKVDNWWEQNKDEYL